MNNKGADQTVRMRKLICAFVVRIWHKTHLLMARHTYICYEGEGLVAMTGIAPVLINSVDPQIRISVCSEDLRNKIISSSKFYLQKFVTTLSKS